MIGGADSLLATAGIGVAALGVLVATHPRQLERRGLGIPPDCAAAQVAALLGVAAGLPARSRLWFEVCSERGQVGFAVEGAAGDLATLRASAQGLLPGLRFGPADSAATNPLRTTSISWRGSHVLLRADEPELATTALLGALQAVAPRERLRLRLRLRPVVRPRAPRRRPSRDRDLLDRVASPSAPIPTDELAAVRKLYDGPLLNVRILLDIWAETPSRAQSLERQVLAVLRSRSGRRGRFSARKHGAPRLPHAGVLATPAQTVALLAWPLGDPAVPGVAISRAPVLPVSPRVPRGGKGRCFGIATWNEANQRAVRQPVRGALSHAVVLGPTGSGKSTLLANLVLDDVAAGRGCLLLDMKGETATDLLARIPEARHRDVVILDPSDHRPLPGLKSLDGTSPELTADLWVGIFHNLFADSWGVRTARYLQLGVHTLAHGRGSTIVDLPRVFADEAFRRRLLTQSGDGFLAAGWAMLDALTPLQRAEHLAAPLGKVQDILGRRVLRAVLGQAQPKVTIGQAIAGRKIVVVRLSPGLVGPPTAQVLGALVIYELYQAVLARQALRPEARTPFGVYVDEPAVLQHLPVPLDALFDLARGLGVGLTLATQSLSQLPARVSAAALTNAATLVTFRPDIEDARKIAPRLTPLTPEQLLHLAPHHAAVRLGLGDGDIADVTTVATPAPRPAITNLERLRDLSASRYGQAATEPESEPLAVAPEAPLGRRTRRPS